MYFIFFTFLQSQLYNIGDIISIDHQNQSFDVCYGNYEPTFRLKDLNGDLNENGKYWITFIDMAATW